MSTFDADTTTLLEGISSQLHTAASWFTGPRSAVLLAQAGQLDDLLAGKTAADIMGGQVTQQTDTAVRDAPDPAGDTTSATEPSVPSNVAPSTPADPVPSADAPAQPDAPAG